MEKEREGKIMGCLKLKTREDLILKYLSYNPEKLTLRALVLGDPRLELTGAIIEHSLTEFFGTEFYIHWFFPECDVSQLTGMSEEEIHDFCVHRRSAVMKEKLEQIEAKVARTAAKSSGKPKTSKARKTKEQKIQLKLDKLTPEIRERYLILQSSGMDISKML